MIAKRIARKVETTAASWGDLPKGTAVAREYDARTRPRMTCKIMMKNALVNLKTPACQIIPTIIHAGRYVREIARCHDMILAESNSPIAFMCCVRSSARSPEKDPGSW
jgi:hypothetical protein